MESAIVWWFWMMWFEGAFREETSIPYRKRWKEPYSKAHLTILIEVQAETAPTEHFALLGPFGVYWQKYGLSPVRIENFWPEPMGILLITIEKICRSCQSRRNSKDPRLSGKNRFPFLWYAMAHPAQGEYPKNRKKKSIARPKSLPFQIHWKRNKF